jgi:hypothetical protein
MTRNRVVWRSSAEPLFLAALSRRRPLSLAVRGALRTAFLLLLLGLVRLAGNPRWRAAVIGVGLIIPGLIARNIVGHVILLPGLMTLFYSPFLPGESHEVRTRHAHLRRELGTYSSPAHRRDLEAILDRYPDGETGELRAILASQTPATAHLRNPGMGPY